MSVSKNPQRSVYPSVKDTVLKKQNLILEELSFNCKSEWQTRSFIFTTSREHVVNILTEFNVLHKLHGCHSFIQYLSSSRMCQAMLLAMGLGGKQDTVPALEQLTFQ